MAAQLRSALALAAAGGAAVLGLLLSARPAGAGPRLTLRLENVTLREALRSLQTETGWDLRINQGGVRGDPPADEKRVRAGFAWTDASVGLICRELGARYGFIPRSWGQRVVNFEAGTERKTWPYTTSRGAYTFTATRINRHAAAEVELAPGVAEAKAAVTRSAVVTLTVRPEHGDPDAIRGLENMRLVTDAGPVRGSDNGPVLRQAAAYGRVDEWEASLHFGELPAGARVVRQLSGELVSYRKVQPARAEVALPLVTAPTRRSAGPVSVLVKSVDLSRRGSIRFEVEVEWGADVTLAGDSHSSPAPMVRLRSGTLIAVGWSAESSDADGVRRSTMSCNADGLDGEDPPVALVWDLTVQSDPSLRTPFRLENVPLPLFPGEKAARPVLPARPETPAAPAVEPATGTVISPVHLEGKPAPAGEVSFGVSRKGGAGWGPVRWQTGDTTNGDARLEGLAPGQYRIRRSYRLRAGDGALRKPAGRWLNDMVTVQVQAGKATTLPTLKQTH